jgi:NAD(P)H dehydrogenase (quinone)
MKVFIVYAHPEPKSFNSALFRVAQDVFREGGHEVQVSDLYAMGFNPVVSRKNYTSVKDPDYFKPQIEDMHATESGGFAPDIEAEIRKMEWCDFMLWQHPLWWFGLPAILKGWVDRCFAMGRTYGGGRLYENGVFKGKRAMLSLTTGGPAEAYAKGGFNGDINAVLRPIHRGILNFTGFDVLAPHIIYAPVRLRDEQRKAILEGYSRRLRQIDKEGPVSVGEY